MMKILLLLEMCFFCHIEIKKVILKTEPIVEIPPEICDRMLFFTQTLNQVARVFGVTLNRTVNVGINGSKLGDRKYFLFSNNQINDIGTYLVGFYILKDI